MRIKRQENARCLGPCLSAVYAPRMIVFSLSRLRMRDIMHWRATNPLDVRPDEWMVDIDNYAWSCSIYVDTSLPKYAEVNITEQIEILGSVHECHQFSQRWTRRLTHSDRKGENSKTRSLQRHWDGERVMFDAKPVFPS